MKKKYNRAAGILLLKPDAQKILILLKRKYRHWEYPKGKIEAGETPIAAAKRELYEEVNVRHLKIDKKFKAVIKYKFRAEGYMIYRSVIFFLAYSSDRVKLSAEHSAYRWCTFAAARRKFRHRNYKYLLQRVEAHLAK